jgi:hypothetical protein
MVTHTDVGFPQIEETLSTMARLLERGPDGRA